MPAAVIYCRISDDVAGERLGVDRQEKLCRDLAKREGITVSEVLVDNDVSAYSKKKRPAFEQLVAMLQGGSVDSILCYHSDRLYRRNTDLERLVDIVEKNGAQVRTVAAGNVDLCTASGRMVARMLGAAAQHESERTSERAKVKHDELAAAGKHPGGRPPFGYSKGYEINAAEAAVIHRMVARALEGASLLRISRELSADGIPTREGKPNWHHSSVRAALINPAIAGLRVHRREIAGPGNWTPILDRATWEQVRSILADPARKRRRAATKYLLSGLVFTPNGDPMNGRPDRGAAGSTDRRTYSTRLPQSGVWMTVDADDLDGYVIDAMFEALRGAKLPASSTRDVAAGERVTAIELELDELAKLRGDGVITVAEWMAARSGVLERLNAARASARPAETPASTARLLAQPGAVEKAWRTGTLDFDAKRDVLRAVVDRIVVASSTRGRWTTIEERMAPENGSDIVFKV